MRSHFHRIASFTRTREHHRTIKYWLVVSCSVMSFRSSNLFCYFSSIRPLPPPHLFHSSSRSFSPLSHHLYCSLPISCSCLYPFVGVSHGFGFQFVIVKLSELCNELFVLAREGKWAHKEWKCEKQLKAKLSLYTLAVHRIVVVVVFSSHC